MSKKRVVILGGGFAGLAAAQSFDPNLTEVSLIDKKNHHLFQPLLYQVATATLSAPAIAKPLRCLLSEKPNVNTYMDEVTAVDLQKQVITGKTKTYEYDYLVLAIGAQTGYFGNNHWAEHTLGMKSLQEALEIRRIVLGNLEAAEMETDPEKVRQLMTVVVVGGGPTGVELAGSISEMGRKVLIKNFRHIDPSQLRVILIEALPRLLAAFPEPLSESTLEQIQELGAEVRLNTKVKDIKPHTVILDGEEIKAGTIIWAAGVEAAALTRTLGVKMDRGGRIEVEPDCSIPGFPNAFAIGDCVRLTDRNGVLVPGVSPGAVQMGEHVVKVIQREIKGETAPTAAREAFSYFDKGSMAIIGSNRAVAMMGPIQMIRFPAWLAWLAVHVLFLAGFRNKATAVVEWIYSYFTRKRGSRIIIN